MDRYQDRRKWGCVPCMAIKCRVHRRLHVVLNARQRATCCPNRVGDPFHEHLMSTNRLDLRNTATFARITMLGVLLSSCGEATRPLEEAVSVCHISGPAGTLLEVGASEVPEHRSHGDYVARLFVSRQSGPESDNIHFARITDAIASARDGRIERGETSTARCR